MATVDALETRRDDARPEVGVTVRATADARVAKALI